MHRAGPQGSTVFAYDARLAAGVASWWISSLHTRRIRSRAEAQRVDQGNDHANLNWNRFWNRELFFPATAASTSACPSEKTLRIMNGRGEGICRVNAEAWRVLVRPARFLSTHRKKLIRGQNLAAPALYWALEPA